MVGELLAYVQSFGWKAKRIILRYMIYELSDRLKTGGLILCKRRSRRKYEQNFPECLNAE